MQASQAPGLGAAPDDIPDSVTGALDFRLKLAEHTAAVPSSRFTCPAFTDSIAAQPPALASVQHFAADPSATIYDVSAVEVAIQAAERLPGNINPAAPLMLIDSVAAEADSMPEVSCDDPEASCESVDEDMTDAAYSNSARMVKAYSHTDMMVEACSNSDHAADFLSCSNVPSADCSSDDGDSLQALDGATLKQDCCMHLSYTAVMDETSLGDDYVSPAVCDSGCMPSAASCEESEGEVVDSACSNTQSGVQSPLVAAHLDRHTALESFDLSACAAGSMMDDMAPSADCTSFVCEKECFSAARATTEETCQHAASHSCSVGHSVSAAEPLNHAEQLSSDDSMTVLAMDRRLRANGNLLALQC